MDDVGPLERTPDFIGLEMANHVTPNSVDGPHPLQRFYGTVLSQVGKPCVYYSRNPFSGERFGYRDQRHLSRIPARSATGSIDALTDSLYVTSKPSSIDGGHGVLLGQYVENELNAFSVKRGSGLDLREISLRDENPF